MEPWLHEDIPKHVSQNRQTSETKLRRSSKHCPICLAKLQKNRRRTRLQKRCVACQAHPSLDKICTKCGSQTIWENKSGAACRQCGLRGTKSKVALHQP